ncbi:hypothetical protein [Facklamia sp. P12950]|uniref:hypothetical protein n=1 Tax=Facklamia sp. P12950 TaxID=3421951 RepID=UPI003D1726DE
MERMESLIIKNHCKERWYPTDFKIYYDCFKNSLLKDIDKPLRKNIKYTLQYLEFIDVQIEEIYLKGTLEKNVYKTYIINACSIIEASLIYIVDKFGEWDNDRKTFNNAIKKVQDQNLLNLDSKLIDQLDSLRKLRNNVHLDKYDKNDLHKWYWHEFDKEDYPSMKSILESFLTEIGFSQQ